jgi:Domain of unknown function (DUF1990)
MSAELASRLASAELTYQDVGGTSGVLPDGYHHLRRSLVIGAGAEVFARAVADLFSWQVHLRAGLSVTASAAAAEPGAVVLLAIGAGPVRIGAPCRVVTPRPGRSGARSSTTTCSVTCRRWQDITEADPRPPGATLAEATLIGNPHERPPEPRPHSRRRMHIHSLRTLSTSALLCR